MTYTPEAFDRDRWRDTRDAEAARDAIRDAHTLRDCEGQRLIDLAKLHTNLTQAELAKASGISPTTLSQIRQGKARVTKAHRAALMWTVLASRYRVEG